MSGGESGRWVSGGDSGRWHNNDNNESDSICSRYIERADMRMNETRTNETRINDTSDQSLYQSSASDLIAT